MGNRDIHLSMRAVEWLTKSPYNYGYQFATPIAHRACDGKLHSIMNSINQHILWCGVEDVRAMFNKTKYKVDFRTKTEHRVLQPTCMDCIIKLEIALEATIMKPYKHLKEYLRVREIEVAGYNRGMTKITDFAMMPIWRGPHSGTYFTASSLKIKPPADDPDWVEMWKRKNGKSVFTTKRQNQDRDYAIEQEGQFLNRGRHINPQPLYYEADDDY